MTEKKRWTDREKTLANQGEKNRKIKRVEGGRLGTNLKNGGALTGNRTTGNEQTGRVPLHPHKECLKGQGKHSWKEKGTTPNDEYVTTRRSIPQHTSSSSNPGEKKLQPPSNAH